MRFGGQNENVPEPRRTTSLPADVRRSIILDTIKRHGFVRVSDLTREYHVSEVTIRTDLEALSRDTAVTRVHGGAMYTDDSADAEPSYEESIAAHTAQKRRIGAAAAALVRDGDTVILDVGSTTGAVADAIAARADLVDVTVLTNSLSHALTLEAAIPRLTVIVTGGTLRPRQHSLVEPYASALFAGIHADIAFIGCTGVDATTGITNVNLPESELKRAMVAASAHVVIVADSSKIGHTDSGIIGHIGAARTLITDEARTSRAALAAITATGIEVVTV